MKKSDFTKIILPDGKKIILANCELFQDRIKEIYAKIPNLDNCFEEIWIEIESVKICLSCLATYLLKGENNE